MQPILASDFGNLGAFMLGVPALGLAILIGVPCFIFRVRVLAVPCGVVCWLTGALFFWSLNIARAADRMITVFFGICSLLVRAALIFIKRQKKT